MKTLLAALLLSAPNAFAGPCPGGSIPVFVLAEERWICSKTARRGACKEDQYLELANGAYSCAWGEKVPEVITPNTPRCPKGTVSITRAGFTACGWKPADGKAPSAAACKPGERIAEIDGVFVCAFGDDAPGGAQPSSGACKPGERIERVNSMYVCVFGAPPKGKEPSGAACKPGERVVLIDGVYSCAWGPGDKKAGKRAPPPPPKGP